MDEASLQTQDYEKKWHVHTKTFYFKRDIRVKKFFVRDIA